MKKFDRQSIAKGSKASKRLSSLAEVIRQVQLGQPVILLDADHREGEGDFAIAAQFCTPERINFLLIEGPWPGLPFIASGRCSPYRRQAHGDRR